MAKRPRQWKLAIERFWQGPAPDYREIVRPVAETAVTYMRSTNSPRREMR
jgi:hypothetical protein